MRISVILILLCGCATTPVKGPDPFQVESGKELEIETKLVPQDRLMEGEIATVTVRIRNRSNRFILLRSLEDAGAGVAHLWQAKRPGALAWDKEFDIYAHDEMAAGTTDEVFNVGMMVPAIEELGKKHFDDQELGLRFRLLDLPRVFKLRYWVLPRSMVLDRVYFPVSVPPKNAPADADRVTRFQLPTDYYLSNYSRERQVGDMASALRKDRFIFSPDVEATKREWTLTLRVKADVPPRPFSREAAIRLAGVAPAKTTYCSRLDAWILQEADGRCVLARREGASRIPPIDFDIFFELDSREQRAVVPKGHVEFQFLDETQILFDEWYGHRPNDPARDIRKTQVGVIFSPNLGEERYAQYLVLPDARVIEFLERAGSDPRIVLKKGPAGSVRVRLR
ncbi:MAG TPA: hypothetical protein VI643_01010 [Planctomycetota bacterium]|nr:hypothetical protein [Planctomycetota bacterium]